MKIIAFKRANHPSLHPEFITEYIDAKHLKSLEGYESMLEEHFLLELAKNEERHIQHLEYLKEQEKLKLDAKQVSNVKQAMEDKEIEREYARFKAWQRMEKNKIRK